MVMILAKLKCIKNLTGALSSIKHLANKIKCVVPKNTCTSPMVGTFYKTPTPMDIPNY